MAEMQQSRIFRTLKRLSMGDPTVQKLLVLIEESYDRAVKLLKTIPLYMRQYTLHDQVHVDRVIELMDRLIPERTFRNIKPLELASLILSATLHDIGMVASASEIESFRRAAGPAESYSAFQAFCEGYSGVLKRLEQFRASGDHSQATELEDYLLSEFLRREHAARSANDIHRNADTFAYGGHNFAKQLADVCVSHSRPPDELDKLPCWELVRSGGERCNWRWVALMLRLADILDFDAKRTPRVLFEHLGIRDRVSLTEWGKHMAVNAWDIAPGRIAFNIKCPDPVIEKSVRTFIDWIDSELIEAPSVLGRMYHPDNPELRDQYAMDLPRRVDRQEIGPASDSKGPLYRYVDIDFTLDRDRIISLVLGVQLYAERGLFLRELLQNAVDACRMRKAQEAAINEVNAYLPRVSVSLEAEDKDVYIAIEDNGVGMDEQIIQRYFARIGKSYYGSSEFLETRSVQKLDFRPISQFGIGVLSVFMAGDHLSIESKRWSSQSDSVSVEITDAGSLFWFKRGARSSDGTKVRLRLDRSLDELFGKIKRDPNIDQLDKELNRLFRAVQEIAAHVEFPITVEYAGQEKKIASTWTVFSDYGRPPCQSVDVDLGQVASRGLNGRVRFFVLFNQSEKKFAQELRSPWDEMSDHSKDTYSHELGFIEHTETRTYLDGEESTGYSAHVESFGKWSQQGIAVNADIFPTHRFSWQPEPPSNALKIPFPIPIHYDIDLSESFLLPLSADRKNVLPSDEAKETCRKIALELTKAFLTGIGKTKAKRNAAVLQQILGLCEEPSLVQLLHDFIR